MEIKTKCEKKLLIKLEKIVANYMTATTLTYILRSRWFRNSVKLGKNAVIRYISKHLVTLIIYIQVIREYVIIYAIFYASFFAFNFWYINTVVKISAWYLVAGWNYSMCNIAHTNYYRQCYRSIFISTTC